MPEPKDKTQRKRQQAIVLEPPMPAFLEERIEQLRRVKDPAWRALLGSWLAGAGCLRCRHIMRSVPRNMTLCSLTFQAF